MLSLSMIVIKQS